MTTWTNISTSPFGDRGTKMCFEIHDDFRWRPNKLIKICSPKIKIVGSDQKIISTRLEVVACMLMFHGIYMHLLNYMIILCRWQTIYNTLHPRKQVKHDQLYVATMTKYATYSKKSNTMYLVFFLILVLTQHTCIYTSIGKWGIMTHLR